MCFSYIVYMDFISKSWFEVEMVDEEKLYDKAYKLSQFTIIYNIIEGAVSIMLGYQDHTLTYLGLELIV